MKPNQHQSIPSAPAKKGIPFQPAEKASQKSPEHTGNAEKENTPGILNTLTGNVTIGDKTHKFEDYQYKLDTDQKATLATYMDIYNGIFSTEKVNEDFITPYNDKITVDLTKGLVREKDYKRGRIYYSEPVALSKSGKLIYGEPKEISVDELTNYLFTDIVESTVQPVDVSNENIP